MILSYPLVSEQGELTGAEVSFLVSSLIAVENLTHWERRRIEENSGQAVIEGCCTISVEGRTFEIKADYNELKALFKQWNGMYED